MEGSIEVHLEEGSSRGILMYSVKGSGSGYPWGTVVEVGNERRSPSVRCV